MNPNINKKLTDVPSVKNKKTLTKKKYTDVKFSAKLCGDIIEKNFSVKKLESEQKSAFVNLLGQMLEMKWEDVEKLYRRNTDCQDKHCGTEQIVHYGKNNDSMRIHGYIDEGLLIITRVDPAHKYHK